MNDKKENDELSELMFQHENLVRMLARRVVFAYGEPQYEEDMIQAGRIGLIEAAKRFDHTRGIRFSTYAVPWIIGEIKRGLCRTTENGRNRMTESLDEVPDGEEKTTRLERLPGGTEISTEYIALRQAIEQLNTDERKVVLLRYFRDRTQRETAEMLGKSQTQISRIERKALDALREFIE